MNEIMDVVLWVRNDLICISAVITFLFACNIIHFISLERDFESLKEEIMNKVNNDHDDK